jgi:hypothetical protein
LLREAENKGFRVQLADEMDEVIEIRGPRDRDGHIVCELQERRNEVIEHLTGEGTPPDPGVVINGTPSASPLHEVILPGGSVRITDAARELGRLLGMTGRFFQRGGAIVRIGADDVGATVLEIEKPAGLVSAFESVARLKRIGTKHGRPLVLETTCTEATAKLIAHAESFLSALPPIRVVSRCPVLTEHCGQLVAICGYDRDSAIRAGDWSVPNVPIADATAVLLALLDDFRWRLVWWRPKKPTTGSVLTPCST